jgi:peptide/nickel transport system permease protein
MTLPALSPTEAATSGTTASVATATRTTRVVAALGRLRRDPAALAALALLATMALLALLAPLVAPYDPSAQPDIVGLKNRPPSFAHPLGTDPFSRDVLSRVLFGARVSLGVGVLAALLSTTIGAAYGAVSGWLGGLADAAMMRLVDAFLGIPRVLLLLAVVALWGRVSTFALVLLIAGTGWFGTSRLARAEVRALRDRDFVHAARALGAGETRLLVRHVVPHLGPLLLVTATLAVGNVIALEAGLSYLGLGVQPPAASWGSIMQDGTDYVTSAWWTTAAPGILIVVTVLAVNVLGDGLRDALDPRE